WRDGLHARLIRARPTPTGALKARAPHPVLRCKPTRTGWTRGTFQPGRSRRVEGRMKLTTKILALACAGLLALAGTGPAHHGNARATVYVAKLMAPGAAATTPAPKSTMKAAQAPTTPVVSGRALLVDGSQNNILVVHVRGLTPNTAYTFDIAGSA